MKNVAFLDLEYFKFSQILFNKAVLSKMNFGFPMFLTSWHMFVACILTQILSRTTNMLPALKEVSHVLEIYTIKLFLKNIIHQHSHL